jgi:hypothetical protein
MGREKRDEAWLVGVYVPGDFGLSEITVGQTAGRWPSKVLATGRPTMGRSNRDRNETVRMFEALLCTLIARAGGKITLSALQVAAHGNKYRLGVRPDDAGAKLILTALKLRLPPLEPPVAPNHLMF